MIVRLFTSRVGLLSVRWPSPKYLCMHVLVCCLLVL